MDDHEQIRQTLATYCQLNDDGRFDEWSQLLIEDCRFQFGEQTVTGRDAIKALVTEYQPPENRGRHFMGNQIIEVDGDTATVRADFVFFAQQNPGFTPFAADRYHDRLIRTDGKWLFEEIRIVPFGQTID